MEELNKHERIFVEVLVLVIFCVLALTFPVSASTVSDLDGQQEQDLELILQRIEELQETMPDDEYKAILLDFMKYISLNIQTKEENALYQENILQCLYSIRDSVSSNTVSVNCIISTNSIGGISQNEVSQNYPTVSGQDICSVNAILARLDSNQKTTNNLVFVLCAIVTIIGGSIIGGKIYGVLRGN